MKRERLTPRNQKKKNNRSVSPHNVRSKSKLKNCFPANRQADKENESGNHKEKNSLKICLDLASYHQKESQMLKTKNSMLEEQLRDQMKDMEGLRSQLSKIKTSVLGGSNLKKEQEQLKAQNNGLKKENERLKNQVSSLIAKTDELVQEVTSLKAKGKQTESIFIENSKCDFEFNPLSFAQQSRRQQLAHKYQSITFVPSVVCLECKRKDCQLEDAKSKYSEELRVLQENVTALQRSQTAIEVMERQIVAKNECIDYLVTQLSLLEADSNAILQNMGSLEIKLRDVTAENVMLKAQTLPTDRLYSSYTKSVA